MAFSETFTVRDGKTHKFSDKLGAYIRNLPDGEYECAVKELEMSKTYDQIKYIHKLISIFSEETGETQFASKLACKEIAGYYKVTKNPIRGGNAIVYRSFADANIKELSEVIDKWYNYLVYDMGINVPTAEQFKEMQK